MTAFSIFYSVYSHLILKFLPLKLFINTANTYRLLSHLSSHSLQVYMHSYLQNRVLFIALNTSQDVKSPKYFQKSPFQHIPLLDWFMITIFFYYFGKKKNYQTALSGGINLHYQEFCSKSFGTIGQLQLFSYFHL